MTGELMKMGKDASVYSLLGWSLVLFGVLMRVMNMLEKGKGRGVWWRD